ncbi:hypothetical protein I4F81_006407 [Pyropia yezoensis]|uniref:Uncharacterized protein n=1 Tax=Pyropia yezoensis TaxID=2788 RepID=A0ACC3C247_PYRYE|nr:hypothetical protein I4F81_006407 [Neopyropia yezoensis]
MAGWERPWPDGPFPCHRQCQWRRRRGRRRQRCWRASGGRWGVAPSALPAARLPSVAPFVAGSVAKGASGGAGGSGVGRGVGAGGGGGDGGGVFIQAPPLCQRRAPLPSKKRAPLPRQRRAPTPVPAPSRTLVPTDAEPHLGGNVKRNVRGDATPRPPSVQR